MLSFITTILFIAFVITTLLTGAVAFIFLLASYGSDKHGKRREW